MIRKYPRLTVILNLATLAAFAVFAFDRWMDARTRQEHGDIAYKITVDCDCGTCNSGGRCESVVNFYETVQKYIQDNLPKPKGTYEWKAVDKL